MKHSKSNRPIPAVERERKRSASVSAKRDPMGHSNSELKIPSDSDTHKLSDPVIQVMPSFLKIESVEDAIKIATAGEENGNRALFKFCGALKSHELTIGRKFSIQDQRDAFYQFWSNLTKDQIGADDTFEHWILNFLYSFKKRNTPLGLNTLEEAVRRAEMLPEKPKCAGKFESPAVLKILTVCWHLQNMVGEQPFGLSARSAGSFTGLSKSEANRLMNGLELMGFLKLVQRGFRGKTRDQDMASTWRFIDSDN